MISARNLEYRYDGAPVIRDLSMDVDPGEFLAVMGGNGAGKTTLLRLLAGLIDPDAGELTRSGFTGFAPENPASGLFADTVEGEVSFFPRNRGIEPSNGVTAAMEALDIGHLRDRNPYTLSRGEQRRVSIAAVLSGEPDVILLDEPTAGLDRIAVDALVGVLEALDASVVASTHDADFALALADRVGVLDAGDLTALGEADELLSDTDRLTAAGIRPPGSVRWARRHGIDRIPRGPREAAQMLGGSR